MDPNKEKYKEETDWWDEVLAPQNRTEWMEDAVVPERRHKQTPPHLLDFISQLGLSHTPRVLDVGSGPLSPLGWAADQKMIEVAAIDPLAEIYGDILFKYGIDHPIKPLQGRGEQVARMFDKGSFDVVYTRNAIDHSDSPVDCVINMVTVLKEGGILYMEGFWNEGTRNNWFGLHHWNLRHEHENLICANKKGKEVNVTGKLPLKCLFSSGPDNNEWYRIVFKKTGRGTMFFLKKTLMKVTLR